MGDYEEAHLVYMCTTLKAIGEKLRDLTHVEKNHSKSQKKNVDTNDHSFRERERERERERVKKTH